MIVEKPPAVPGVRDASVRDHLLALWWLGRFHAWSWRSVGDARSGVLAAAWWIALPATVPLTASRPWRRRVRYYATDQAHLAIEALTASRWRVQDHIAREMGAGHGAALRRLVLGPVLEYVDAHGIALELDTRSVTLAGRYAAELGGEVTPGPRGLFLVTRQPATPTP